MREVRLALLGFGSVGRRFARLLLGPYGRTLRSRGVRVRVTAIASARHGIAVDPRGLPLGRVLRAVEGGRALRAFHRWRPVATPLDVARRAPADVLLELTPLDPRSGEPALTHAREALRRGLHVVTANKGPVAYGLRRLVALARRRGVRFVHESAVMDGTPVFNLVARCLPGVRILGFRGVLNSTTTRILSRVEEGASAEAALREAQAAGVAEADPRHDLEGWDAAVKSCVIANALMGADVRPSQVRRRGIGTVTPSQVRRAVARGERVRLVARGRRRGRGVVLSVAPEAIPVGDLLASRGGDGVVVFETDQMREIGIWEGAGGVDQTAYGLLADLVDLVGD